MEYTIKIIKNIFSTRLRELRTQSGLSQNEMARILGILQSSYEQYESKKALPRLDNLIAIAQYFEVSLNYLVGLDDI